MEGAPFLSSFQSIHQEKKHLQFKGALSSMQFIIFVDRVASPAEVKFS